MTQQIGNFDSGGHSAVSASTLMTGRIFLLENPRFSSHVPRFLGQDRSGMILSGDGAHKRADQVWRQASVPLVIDPARYTDQMATPDEPFALGNEGTLIDIDLDTLLTGQRECHATVALTPSRYVQAGDSAAFKALVRAAQGIEREDVVVAVPVALPWLTQHQYLQQLIAGLQRIPHPKALIFGHQKNQNNPFEASSAISAFRRLLTETTGVGLWRADVLAAFDCIAHGGAFAAIGAGGSLRHLVPPDLKATSHRPGAHTPSVLLPAMLRYSMGRFIADKYASTPAPQCDCVVCGGATLNRFDSLIGEVRADAHAHNAAVWTAWLSDLFGHPAGPTRQIWWRGLCQAAVDAHVLENARLRQKGAFKPPVALMKFATLPLHAEAKHSG